MNKNMIVPVPLHRDPMEGTALFTSALSISCPSGLEDTVSLFLENTGRTMGPGYPVDIEIYSDLSEEEYWLTITEQ